MLNNYILIFFIAALLIFAIYDEFVLPRRKGKTLLRLNLKPRFPVDGLIFAGLVGILIYRAIEGKAAPETVVLLSALLIVVIFLFFIRRPRLIFKNDGFFYTLFFIDYDRISDIHLSEKGLLLIKLEQKAIVIRVKNPDDLSKIYQVLSKQML